MSNLFLWEGANLFAGDHDPTSSNHLTLETIKLPELEEMMSEHHPGGSKVQVEVGVGIKKLEPTFKTKGFQPHLLRLFGLGSGLKKTFTVYQAYNDKRTGRIIENKAIIVGRLGKIAPDEGKRGEVQGHDYAINEVWRYEVYFDGKEELYWSFETGEFRVGGQSTNRETNAILRIPGFA